MTKFLHCPVGEVRTENFHFFQHRIGAAFQGEEERHFVGAELVDHQKRIFAVLLSDVVNIAVHIFTGDRQMLEFCQNMTADLRQHLWLVGADVKDLLVFFGFEGVQTHGKDRELACTTGRFKQPIRVGVIACGRVCVDISDTGNVVVIVRVTPVVANIVISNTLVIQFAQDLLRGLAQFDTQMVNQL